MRKYLGSGGFSMVEILVASGLLGAVSLGVAQMMKNSSEGQSQIAAKDDMRSSAQKISSILSNPDACSNTLKTDVETSWVTVSTDPSGQEITNIKNKDNAVVISKDEKFGKITYVSFILKNYRAASDSAELVVKVKFRKSSTIELERSSVIPIALMMDLSVPGTPRMISCSASNNDSSLWAKSALPDIGIYYSGGSIKMGTGLVDSGSTVPSMIMGTDNTVIGENSAAMGVSNEVGADLSMAFGYTNTLNISRAYAIGGNNTIGGSEQPDATAIAVGSSNWVDGHNALALGSWLTVTGQGSVAIGLNSTTTDTINPNSDSIVIGTGGSSTSESTIAIGTGATAVAENALALGTGSMAVFSDSVAIGKDSGAVLEAVAIGKEANANGNNSIAIGELASAFTDGIAIGKETRTTSNSSIAIGSAGPITINSVTAVRAGAISENAGSIVIGPGATDAKSVPNLANTADYGPGDLGGFGANFPGQGSTAVGLEARASGHGSVAYGARAQAQGIQATAIGNNAHALGRNALAVGSSDGGVIQAFGHTSMAIGPRGVGANNYRSAAIGVHLNANHDNSMILGMGPMGAVSSTQAAGELQLRGESSLRLCVGANDTTPATYTTNCLMLGAPGSAGGGWTWASDRNLKKKIKKLDADEVLEKISELDVSTWVYKNQGANAKNNIGPMAQDFHRLFVVPYRLGGTDKTIAPNDVFNFGIIGIQALDKKVKDLTKENDEMREVLCELKPSAKFCKK